MKSDQYPHNGRVWITCAIQIYDG